MSTVKSATQLFVLTEQCSPISSQSLLTFELFSVMVHSGSAAGGHYYACIKSFSDGQWYSFNDQHVSKVSLCSWVTRFGFLLKVNVRQCLPFLYTRPKKNCQLQLPFKMLLIVIVVTSVEWFFFLFHCVHFCQTDHPGWYQENIWGILREQRLFLRCLCKVSCVPQQSQALRPVGNPQLAPGKKCLFLG